VNFENPFEEQPIVYLNAEDTLGEVEASTLLVTKEYFEAQIVPSVDYQILIKWIALLSDEGNPERLEVIESSEMTRKIEIIEEETKQATQSAEASSSAEVSVE